MSHAIAPYMKATTWAAAGRLFSFGEGRGATAQAAMEVKRLQIRCCLQANRRRVALERTPELRRTNKEAFARRSGGRPVWRHHPSL
jgi:hypothetical protein